jgi:hypothetical protein
MTKRDDQRRCGNGQCPARLPGTRLDPGALSMPRGSERP